MLKFLLFLYLLAGVYLFADTPSLYSLRLAHGQASQNNFGEIISGDLGSHPRDLSVTALDGGYLLFHDIYDLPFDLYLRSSLSYFNEDQFDDAYEVTLYFKLYYNLDFWGNRVRLGFGEGGSYTSAILETEYLEAQEKNDNNSKYLNYIDVSLDFDLGRLIRVDALRDLYIGYALKHRSGIFGLINNVKKGGSNYNTLYLEKKF